MGEWVAVVIVFVMFALFAWALCVNAGMSDREISRMMDELDERDRRD